MAEETKPNPFEIDEEYIDTVYEELKEMQVELDVDPVAFGPNRLNEKIALTRSMLDRCEQVFVQVSYDLQRFKRESRKQGASLQLQINHLLASDPRVQAGRSVRDREAMSRNLLQDDVSALEKIEAGIGELEALLIVIKAKRADLKDTSSRLRDQIRLCRDELEFMGRKWGSQVPGAKPLRNGGVAEEDPETDIEALLGDVEERIERLEAPKPLPQDDEDEEEEEEEEEEDLDVEEDEEDPELNSLALDLDEDEEDDDLADNILSMMGLGKDGTTKVDPDPEPELELDIKSEPDPEPEPEPFILDKGEPQDLEEVLAPSADDSEVADFLDEDAEDDEADILGVSEEEEDLDKLLEEFDLD